MKFNIISVDIAMAMTVCLMIPLSSGCEKHPPQFPRYLTTEYIEEAVEKGIDINSIRDDYDRTLLHLAATNGQVYIANMLINNGVDVNARGKQGWTPLHMATYNQSSRVVKLLIEHGADIEAKNRYDATPLHFAADAGRPQNVELLIRMGANVNACAIDGRTPLHKAIGPFGKPNNITKQTVKLLIAGGASLLDKGKTHLIPVEFALVLNNKEIAVFLIEQMDIHLADQNGDTLLHHAARNNNINLVEILLDHGADVNAKNNYGSTALDLAIRFSSRNPQLHQLLISRGAVRNEKSNQETIVKDRPTESEVLTELKTFLEAGGDIEHYYYNKMTALHRAAQNGHGDIVAFLLLKGANVNAKTKTKAMKDFTALHFAVFSGHIEIARTLIENGARINEKNAFLFTPLHYAVVSSDNRPLQSAFVQLLIDNGVDVEAEGRGDRPLFLAAGCKNEEVVKLLIAAGADVNGVSAGDQTPLHQAALNGRKKIAEILIKNGARINAKTVGGQTPLDYIQDRDDTDIQAVAELLRKHGGKSGVRP